MKMSFGSMIFCSGLLAINLVSCSKSKIGEGCDADDKGKTEACEDGGICTNEGSNQFNCRKLCNSQEDCPAATNCNGVSNTSLKSCQPK